MKQILAHSKQRGSKVESLIYGLEKDKGAPCLLAPYYGVNTLLLTFSQGNRGWAMKAHDHMMDQPDLPPPGPATRESASAPVLHQC